MFSTSTVQFAYFLAHSGHSQKKFGAEGVNAQLDPILPNRFSLFKLAQKCTTITRESKDVFVTKLSQTTV
jgi:hypothetical protein